MTRTQSLERIFECEQELLALEIAKKASDKDFKKRREILISDKRMCMANLDQMTLEEVAE